MTASVLPVKRQSSLFSSLRYLLGFNLSEKMKFALKTSLSIVIVYLVSFAQGWQSPSTAAITIALVASVDSLSDSLIKGALRVTGTIIGAAIGIWLIALYPQDRMLYLAAASIGVTLFFYLARVYRGDTTIFFLTGMTMLLVFQDNNAQDAFLYGINRTYMTLFGIVTYTFVGMLLWPINITQKADSNAAALSDIQLSLFKDAKDPLKRDNNITQLLQQEQALRTFTRHTFEMDMSRQQWLNIVESYRKINEALLLYINDLFSLNKTDISNYVEAYQQLKEETEELLVQIPHAWRSQQNIDVPAPFTLCYNKTTLKHLPLLTRARITSLARQLGKLHETLRELALKLNGFNSMQVHLFTAQKKHISDPYFNWGDPEALKGSVVTFLLFWASVSAWIWFNPPLGFFLVIMATSFSFLTAFSPLKPSLLMLLYTVSFLFAIISYIFILPNLNGTWQLSLFLFVYSFIAFYFIDLKASLFFIIALSTLNIANEMYYAFDIFLLILLFFYLFLLLLMLFYYIPFSTKPEHLYLTMQKRFFRLFYKFLLSSRKKMFPLSRRKQIRLRDTLNSMQLWSSQIDSRYFSSMKKQEVAEFIQSCRYSSYLLTIYLSLTAQEKTNSLFQNFSLMDEKTTIPLLRSLNDNQPYQKKNYLEETWEKEIDIYLDTHKEYSTEAELTAFFEYISLQRSLFEHLQKTWKQMHILRTEQLKESRF